LSSLATADQEADGPDLLLVPAIQASLKDILQDRSPAALIEEIYLESDAGCLTALGLLLPNDQIRCLSISEAKDFTQFETALILLAALQVLNGDVRWIHWNIAKYFDLLERAGLKSAKFPLLLHALLAKENFSNEPSGQTFVNALAAQHLLPIAPRDAAFYAIEACKGGDLPALAIAQTAGAKLGVKLEADAKPGILNLVKIASQLGFPPPSGNTLTLANQSRTSSNIVEPAVIFQYPKRPEHGRHYLFRDAERRIKLPEIEIFTFQNATFSIDISKRGRTEFYVFDEKQRCVMDLCRGFKPFITDTVEHIPGALAILDDGFSGAMNICHFLLDRLTRVALYDRCAELPDWFLLAEQEPYYTQAVERFGISERILTRSRRFSVKADQLMLSSNITSAFCHPAHLCAPWAITALRQSLKVPNLKPHKRIFISRNDTQGRKVLNEPALRQLLVRYDFEIVSLTNMPLAAQIELFAQAEIVAGVHGAGLTNILFASPACRVIEILPPLVATQAYWLLAAALGQQYSVITAKDPEIAEPDYRIWQHNADYNGRDVIVPLDELEKLLTY
jgi:hypothetical protein